MALDQTKFWRSDGTFTTIPVSADANNAAFLGSDNLIYVPMSMATNYIEVSTNGEVANWSISATVGHVLANLDVFNPGSNNLFLFIYDATSATGQPLMVTPLFSLTNTSINTPIKPVTGLYIAGSSTQTTFTAAGTFRGLLHYL
jgi:hypothetical protein